MSNLLNQKSLLILAGLLLALGSSGCIFECENAKQGYCEAFRNNNSNALNAEAANLSAQCGNQEAQNYIQELQTRSSTGQLNSCP